jgi:cytochrome c
MESCKDIVKITARAAVVDVTPEDANARQAREAGAEAIAEPVVEVTPAPGVPDPELVVAGERAFRQCAACHKLGEGARNGTGPELNGIVGRPAGHADGFRYSPAMIAKGEEGLVWTPENIDAFITKPRDFVNGTRMSYAGMRDPEMRAAIIAYLSTFVE